MLRPVEAEFAPRAQVFPGGRIDDADADPAWAGLCDIGAADADRIADDGADAGSTPFALSYRIGAIREVFEETTVLLGTPGVPCLTRNGPPLRERESTALAKPSPRCSGKAGCCCIPAGWRTSRAGSPLRQCPSGTTPASTPPPCPPARRRWPRPARSSRWSGSRLSAGTRTRRHQRGLHPAADPGCAERHLAHVRRHCERPGGAVDQPRPHPHPPPDCQRHRPQPRHPGGPARRAWAYDPGAG